MVGSLVVGWLLNSAVFLARPRGLGIQLDRCKELQAGEWGCKLSLLLYGWAYFPWCFSGFITGFMGNDLGGTTCSYQNGGKIRARLREALGCAVNWGSVQV
jgi:hypothetical protein